MLSICPECELSVSDKAAVCPHCGYPLKPEKIKIRQTRRRRKLPNGFGQITEIKGKNLRKPFRAMVTVGTTPEGRPIAQMLKPEAYFETYNEAYAALVEYNKTPHEKRKEMTVAELYDEWLKASAKRYKRAHSIKVIEWSYSYLTPLHKMKVTDVRGYHIKECIENSQTSDVCKQKMKNLCNKIFDYAVEYDIVERNCAREVRIDIESEKKKPIHKPYTEEEMALLWKYHNSIPAIEAQLIQCYSGWRPDEILNITADDVNLDEWTFTGGMKTAAGINRVVPIHPCIRDIVRKRVEYANINGYKYLIYDIGQKKEKDLKISYRSYSNQFETAMRALGMNHILHDGRVHFVTQAKKYDVNEYAIKRIVGHSIQDITERIYTRRPIEWLQNEISKIPPGNFSG